MRIASLKTTVLALMLCQATTAHAALPTIDDFSAGLFYRPTPNGVTSKTFKAANIAGGARTITTYVNANTLAQYSATAVGRGLKNVSVGPGLFFSTGYGVAQRADLGYGENKAMSLDLTAYARFRVHFSNASIVTLADFQTFTGSAYVQWGCNNITTNGSDLLGDVTVDYPFVYGAGVDYSKCELHLFDSTEQRQSLREQDRGGSG